MKRHLFIHLLLLCFFSSIQAQEVQVVATADTAHITVGDPVKLKLEATVQGKGGMLSWPKIPKSFGSLEVLEEGVIDTVAQEGYAVYRQQIILTGFDSGAFYIPSFHFQQQQATGTVTEYSTDSLPLLVQTMVVDTTRDFKPLKDILEVPFSIWDYPRELMLIGGGILLIAALVIGYYYWRRSKVIPGKMAIVELPHEIALRRLVELQQQNLWQQGKVKTYYVQLSLILRSYLKGQFRINAPELTTNQLLLALKDHPILRLHATPLETVLSTADVAKFAKGTPTAAQHEHAWEVVHQLVLDMRPEPVDLLKNSSKAQQG